jgi:exopolysaccharide biosynthesis protein
VLYSILLASFATFVLLDTFVIPRVGTPVVSSPAASQSATGLSASVRSDAAVTSTSYEDDNISITIETLYEYGTYLYVADIQVSDAKYLKTALAQNTYGRNIKDTTSDIAEDNNAIFAINGDYYGFRNDGYVLRNGVLYRGTASSSGEDLVIDADGNFSIVEESQTDAEALAEDGVWQVFSFGPALVNNGEICVTASSEVAKSMTSNPRTAIGQISALHYIVIVSDGRTDESAGLSLLQLAQEFEERGCTVAYNLDGGGSSAMWFNGEIINNPVGGNKSDSERSVSDIVYFGYQ